MFPNRGALPLSYHRIGRADLCVISGLELEPEQVTDYLGPIQEIQAAVRSGLSHNMVGVSNSDALIGFYVLHPDRRDNACWWLGWLALDCRHQGNGYGRMALARILTDLRHIAGCRRVRLLVDPINGRARHLYEQVGFRQIAVHGSGELILELALFRISAVQRIVALLRASSASKRARRAGRLRSSPGPHVGPVMGVERGPPDASTPWLALLSA